MSWVRLDRKRAARTLVLISTAIAIAAPSGAPARTPLAVGASEHCRALRVGLNLRSEMIATYRRVSVLPRTVKVVIHERIKYGRCGTTHYAWGLPTPAAGQQLSEQEQITLQDHSPIFRRRPGHPWAELGVGGICEPGELPRAMAHAWHLSCG